MRVKDQLVAHGSVSRGRIGVGIAPVDEATARQLGLKSARGALVGSLDLDGPAAAAGLRNGDVILALNGEPVTDATDLPSRVMELTPGADVPVGIWRHGARRTTRRRAFTPPSWRGLSGGARRAPVNGGRRGFSPCRRA